MHSQAQKLYSSMKQILLSLHGVSSLSNYSNNTRLIIPCRIVQHNNVCTCNVFWQGIIKRSVRKLHFIQYFHRSKVFSESHISFISIMQ